MQAISAQKPLRLRSFVRRDSRRTKAQARAHETLWPRFGLTLADEVLKTDQVFGRQAPCFLEIGFGSGQSLLATAKAAPDKDFIGVETYKPGIGALLIKAEEAQLTNLRIYDGDVVDLFENSLADDSLAGIQIFFPDPWQKRRHHPRRLIQSAFVQSMISKCQSEGSLHLATDWEDYAHQMMMVLTGEAGLINLAGTNQFAGRSCYRPVITKFELRAKREGRAVWELQFEVNK